MFHVTASRNRESIERFGLDWTQMRGVRGVAGSSRPEVNGVFLCRDDFEVDFFCGMNANDEPVDVWEVDGVDAEELVQAPEGFVYFPEPIPRENLALWQGKRLPSPSVVERATDAYQSTLTVSIEDGQAGGD